MIVKHFNKRGHIILQVSMVGCGRRMYLSPLKTFNILEVIIHLWHLEAVFIKIPGTDISPMWINSPIGWVYNVVLTNIKESTVHRSCFTHLWPFKANMYMPFSDNSTYKAYMCKFKVDCTCSSHSARLEQSYTSGN